jgi:protein SCO1/2
MFRTLLYIFVVSLILISSDNAYSSGFARERQSEFDPNILKIDEDNFLGKTIPTDITLINEKGESVQLKSLLGKPLVLSLIFYKCPATCKPLSEGLAEALGQIKQLRLGPDYRVLTLSFDEMDTAKEATQFHNDLKKKVKMPQGEENWAFATASKDDIKRLTEAVGFRFFFVEQDKMFVHPNAYIFLSPEGKITRYIFGLYPIAFDVRMAILEAASGRVGKAPLFNAATLACYKYDPTRRGYVMNLPFVFGMVGLSLLTLTLIIAFVFARNLKKNKRLYAKSI